jgi:radical SAM protein with 4Fe4S-binding SPASM domain
MRYLKNPKSLMLQWHLTERCNWNCKHCYQDNSIKDEMTISELFKVLKQFISLLKLWNIPKSRARINFSGGEILLRKDIFKFFKEVDKYSNYYNWGIMSNGSLITKKIAKKLKMLGLSSIQVSMEGLKKNNDEIRGKGTYEKIISAIKILVKEGVKTSVSMTLTKNNLKDVPKLSEKLIKLGVGQLNTRRFVPLGNGLTLKNILIEPFELRSYYRKVQELNAKFKNIYKNGFSIFIGCESSIFNDETKGEKYMCGLYDGSLLVVMQNGDILACRRLPKIIGNIKQQSLFEVYYNSKFYQQLRDINKSNNFCKKCNNFRGCYGGAKCVTYARTKKLFIPDVDCWKVNKESFKL